MNIAVKSCFATLAVATVFTAMGAQAASQAYINDANAPARCQAFTPGPTNTVRNRVTGSENIGAAMNVACAFENVSSLDYSTNVVYAGVQIANNYVSDCAFTAIRSNAGSNVQITSNQCFDSGETAIYSEFGFDGAMIANNIIDGAANGILSVNFNEGGRLAVISGNLIRNLKLSASYEQDDAFFGIGIEAESDAAVMGNVIEGAPRWGMLIGWGPYLRDVNVTGNVIRNATVGIAATVVEGARQASIRQNIFSGIKEAAIAGYRWIDRRSGRRRCGRIPAPRYIRQPGRLINPVPRAPSRTSRRAPRQ